MEQYIEKDGKRLRLGYTTGSCAAAAAKAAAWMLLTGRRKETITLDTPKGIRLELAVREITMRADSVSCAIEKDSGDDPDVTKGTLIFASVRRTDEPGVHIDGGEGVGRVTKRGLDQPVGNAAINSVPRQMIRENVEEVMALTDSSGGLDVVISAPEGADIYVDGAKVGATRFEGALAFGSHTAYAMQGGKKSGEKNINVSMEGGAVPAVTLAFHENKTFTVNGVSFEMVFVGGGTFQMGGNYIDELPVHSVTLSDYYIGQTEVTQELWKAVMGSSPSYSDYVGAKNPVNDVSWNDCQEFISKLNRLTGGSFRLPTEAEWEYAARGGNKSRGYKYSGSDYLGSVAWYKDNSGDEVHPVGSKSANELGLYDMSGNVWEWCSDWYGDYPSSPQTNPTGPSSGSGRVLRGGSYCDGESLCRSAYRSNYFPTYWCSFHGLRLAY